MKFAIAPLLALVALVGTAPQAKASLVFTLTADGCTGTCGTGPFGTITLTQTAANIVNVEVDLATNVKFVATGAGSALGFNLPGFTIASGDISNLTTGFAFLSAGDSFSTFGSFQYAIDCVVPTGCGNGASNPNPGPLNFTITKAGLTLTSFTGNAGGYYFASDVIGNNGKTGNVATGKGDPGVFINEVPEPMTMSLLGLGLFGLSAAQHFKNKNKRKSS